MKTMIESIYRNCTTRTIAFPLIVAAGLLAGCEFDDPEATASLAAQPTDEHTAEEHASETLAGEQGPTVEEEHAHADEDEDHHELENVVDMSPAELEEFGIEVGTAQAGALSLTKAFPGEIKVNEERYAHVVARVSGVAASVSASVGERVEAGDVMAVLESRDLAAATAAYLGARQRQELSQATFEREERLYEREISPERKFLEARQALGEVRIDVEATRQALRALGLSNETIEELPDAPDAARYQYLLTAPIDGVVIERHLTRGEAVEADTEAFEIADLSDVWVDLSIYQEDLDVVREEQGVVISAGGHSESGTISYVRPIVGENTRTALARVVLPNPHGRWRPGMFVSGSISIDRVDAPVVIPKSAVQTIDSLPVVFVRTADGFRPRPIVTGDEGERQIAVLEGLTVGEDYVTAGAFTLKAQLDKGSFEDGHSH